MIRRSLSVAFAAAAVLCASLAGCAPETPPSNLTRISPDDGTGYVSPRISADGDVVVYRREADQALAWWEPRDLIVSRVSTHSTQVFPSVGGIEDMSDDGRYVTHTDLLQHLWRLDTITGAEELVVSGGPVVHVDGGQMSADGSTIWTNTTEWSPSGNCPCTYTIRIWRNGSIVTELPYWDVFDSLVSGDFVGPSPDGSAVFVHRSQHRDIVRIDIPSGVVTPLALTFPDLPSDWGVWGSQESWLNSRERLEPDATDGSQFRLRSGDHTYLLTTSATTEVPQIEAVRSPNLRWSAAIRTQQDVRPGVDQLRYVVRDEVGGTGRTVATAESSPPTIYPTFTVEPSVADTGRTAVARWNVPLSGEWPPSVVYIDG